MFNMGVNPSSTSLTHEELDEPRRNKRARVVKDFESDFVTYNIEDDPLTFKDAMVSSEAKQRKEVVKRSCLEIIIETKSFLKNKFEMKDIGEADVILGIKLIRSTDEIVISQSHYVEKIIEKFGYQNSRIAKTLYDASVALFKNESGFAVATKNPSGCLGERSALEGSPRSSSIGRSGSKNVGLGNANIGENPMPRNLRVPPQGSSTEGESGPKIRPKGVVDGQQGKNGYRKCLEPMFEHQMFLAVIRSALGYPAFTVGTITGTPEAATPLHEAGIASNRRSDIRP
ncbi:UNVERIFIED_CONTAM: hypothetical protein Scaly_1025700 [Sesamum calycinum]|uniref:Reverse transcriptase Ty1/copia-type domain-containing protein n=1 Tax=Sesamum calycinum TaxID=2727403 RepID=A0AAW2QJT6_9LAMI